MISLTLPLTFFLIPHRPAKHHWAAPLVWILGYSHRITKAGSWLWSLHVHMRSTEAGYKGLCPVWLVKISKDGHSTTSLIQDQKPISWSRNGFKCSLFLFIALYCQNLGISMQMHHLTLLGEDVRNREIPVWELI